MVGFFPMSHNPQGWGLTESFSRKLLPHGFPNLHAWGGFQIIGFYQCQTLPKSQFCNRDRPKLKTGFSPPPLSGRMASVYGAFLGRLASLPCSVISAGDLLVICPRPRLWIARYGISLPSPVGATSHVFPWRAPCTLLKGNLSWPILST